MRHIFRGVTKVPWRIPPGVRTIVNVTATPDLVTTTTEVPASERRRAWRRADRWIVAATLAVSGGLLTACGGGGTGESAASAAGPAAAAPVAVATTQPLPRGEAQYKKSCTRCHGAAMEGRNGTPAMDARRIATQTDQMLTMHIQYGKGKMPAFGGLSTEQINDIIFFLRSLV